MLIATQAAVAINNKLFIISPGSPSIQRVCAILAVRALFTVKKSPQKTQADNKARAIEIRRLRALSPLKINFEQGWRGTVGQRRQKV